MKTVNNKIACAPVNRDFKPELKASSGFGTIEQRSELVELNVVLNSDSGYENGDSVYVNGGVLDRSGWAKSILSLDGMELILVPVTEVIIIKKKKHTKIISTKIVRKMKISRT